MTFPDGPKLTICDQSNCDKDRHFISGILRFVEFLKYNRQSKIMYKILSIEIKELSILRYLTKRQ